MNVAMVLEMAADGMGSRIAIGNAGDGFTYSVLRDEARATAARIPVDVRALAVLSPTGLSTPVALFGAAWAGVSYVPLNFRLPEQARAELLAQVQPAAVLDQTLGTVREHPRFVDEPLYPAALLFTSGTSATPKAVVLEHDNLLAYLFNTVSFASAGEDEALLLAVPPFHVAGLAAILSATYSGRRIVPLPRFDAERWLDTAREEHATHAFVVPTMLSRIVDVLEQAPDATPHALRHLAYGGARMPRPIIERALTVLPDVAFVNAYGLTETSSTVCVLGPDEHRRALTSNDPAVRARLTSAGRPVPGVEVRIVSASAEPVEPGTVGEIWLRGAQIGGGYLDAEVSRDADGWLRTGDVGHLDAEGFLFVAGRGDGTIIRGGENLSASEIEDALLLHPEVAAAAVVGLPDPEWGEQVGAMVAQRSGKTVGPDAIREFVRERLGSLKTPSKIIICDDVPQTATGKVLHRAVRERFRNGDDAAEGSDE